MDVTIDTSSWARLDSATIPRLATKLRELGARLVVPMEVVSEHLDGPQDPQVIWNRISSVGEIAATVETVICQSQVEMRETERLRQNRTGTPIADDEYRNHVLRICRERAYFDSKWHAFEEVGEHLGKADYEALQEKADANAASFLERTPELSTYDGDQSARDSLRDYLSNPTRLLLESELVVLAGSAVGLSARALLDEADRWPSTLALGLCVELGKLAKVQAKFITPNKRGREVKWLVEGNRNNLVDDRIVASAAYSRFFVTNDRLQRDKARYVAAYLNLPLHSIWLPSFLDNPANELLGATRPAVEPLAFNVAGQDPRRSG